MKSRQLVEIDAAAAKKPRRKVGELVALLRPSKHPVDKLLPGSRMQAMKALLERAERPEDRR